MKDALIVFAKPPVPGRVKTRLTELITEEEAAALYEAFLRDALDQYACLDAAVRLYLSSLDAAKAPAFVPDGIPVFEQRGEGLGARMRRAFRETFSASYERVVIIGTDHPTLPTIYIERAFAALAEPKVVSIGPSEDGGYYLLGMNAFYPGLFEGMTYSHSEVFEETLQRIRASGVQSAILPQWYDVDTPEALRRLAGDLEQADHTAPHTRQTVERLQRRYPILEE